MKLRFEGKVTNSSPSALFGQRKEPGGQLADHESDMTTSRPPNILVHGASNAPNYVVSDGTQNTMTNGIHSESGPYVNVNESDGFFANAHHLIFLNPTMVDQSTNISQVAGDREAKAKKLLSKYIISGAAHNSSARDPPPRCHPGTRIKINERITAWFHSALKQELILWIYGAAGVGKSAIVQTIAEALAIAECLGASVFFSRPHGRNISRSVFITVAYQLAVHIGDYCKFISERLASDPELVNKGMEEQFRTFIIEPFVEKKIGAGGKTWGILLDGLDELDERHWQREIIRLITTFALQHPDVPLVWVIASRPEPHIVDTFKAPQTVTSYWEQHVSADSPESCQDVERYLRSSFEAIRGDFPRIVPEDWPNEMQIVQLTHAACGLFAFAEAAARFIGDPNHADPVTRLQDVLAAINGSVVNSAGNQPFTRLDILYTYILSSILPEMWPITKRVLGATLHIFGYLRSAKGLSVLLDCRLTKIYTSINDLYSVLSIPLNDVYSQLSFHHASFPDFLQDVTRSKEFCVSFEDARRDLNECGVRVWRDFKVQSLRGSSAEYEDRWSEFASQFHCNGDRPEGVLSNFNKSLFYYIHLWLLASLQEKWDLARKEAFQRHWDQFLDLLSQVDAATACHGWQRQHEFVSFLFEMWKTYQDSLSTTGIIHEIPLDQLQLDHLEYPKEIPTSQAVKFKGLVARFNAPRKRYPIDTFHQYMTAFKYIRKHNPNLPVLVCGPIGSRFAVFIYKYLEHDCKEGPLHFRVSGVPNFDKYEYHGFYCMPYPDNV